MRLKGELASCQAVIQCSRGCERYEEAVQYSVETLGLDDEDTIKLRFGHARCLEKSGQTNKALKLLSTMIADMKDSLHKQQWQKVLTKHRYDLSKRFASVCIPTQRSKRPREGIGNTLYVENPPRKRINPGDRHSFLDKENHHA